MGRVFGRGEMFYQISTLVAFVAFQSVLADRLPYIFNGRDVDHPGKYAWQASVQTLGGWHFCGGSLIDRQWVLTARHCTKGKTANKIKVILGMHDIKTKKLGKPKTYKVKQIIEYPQCNSDKLSCDFSLLKLASPADLSSPYINTIALPSPNEKFDKAQCVLTGWGTMKNGNKDPAKSPNVLQEIDVKVYTDKQCHGKVRRHGWPIICVKAGYGGSRPGDSGGPASCRVDGVWKVAGVCSFGIGDNTLPNVYAETADVVGWIKQKTGI